MFEKKYSLLDGHFAKFMAERSEYKGQEKVLFQTLVKNLSASLGEGHSCLPVKSDEAKLLLKSSLISDGGNTPLILTNKRLYLHKYYTYERRLAQQLADLAASQNELPIDRGLLDTCFADDNDEIKEIDWQKKAAETALKKGLCIISGGPGTGKTSTVVKIIGLLLQLLDADQEIALAAPTGKAAMRLRASIGNSLATLPFPQAIIERIPTEAMTLHRLLGIKRNSPQFRHNHENPLPHDVVVVDEASMVDLALMSKLVDGLKPGARLILLGDKDQLASVESGSVLADLIGSLPVNTVELKKTYRFNAGIKELAEYMKNGDGEKAWSLLQDNHIANVALLETSLTTYVGSRYANYMAKVRRVKELGVGEIFRTFNDFRVLCGIRHGRHGVAGINTRVEQYLSRSGYDCFSGAWYPGRPVLITRNDYSLGLYNGDIGICLYDEDDSALKVWFEQSDRSYKRFPPFRLPQCETVYGMTIHKSQGSEFDEVLVVLPEEDSQVLSRELIYTAVTRAKRQVRVLAKSEICKLSLARKVRRFSGLAEAIVNFTEK